MSLYYDALTVLENKAGQGGTLKSRVYNTTNINSGSGDNETGRKSSPAQIYALLTETRKWSPFLAEVIDRSEILRLERKLTPQLALLLVHDLLLAKQAPNGTDGKGNGVSGIAASARHPLRLAIEKHKARLRAEFTKLRVKRGYASVKAFRAAIDAEAHRLPNSDDNVNDSGGKSYMNSIDIKHNFGPQSNERAYLSSHCRAHPRWVRVNALKTTLEEQLRTTFAAYTKRNTLREIMTAPPSAKVLKVDELVPDLLALPLNHELSSNEAYMHGRLIIQDKASCFPALLLLPKQAYLDGDIIDACAAPGNKTTHLAALMQSAQQRRLMVEQREQLPGDEIGIRAKPKSQKAGKIFAFERDAKRTMTLRKMVSWAGAVCQVNIKGCTDFLRVNPKDEVFARVKAILLDPSCSGSGIVGRGDDEEPEIKMILPQSVKRLNGNRTLSDLRQHGRKKRKLNGVESEDMIDTSVTAAQATNKVQKEVLTDSGDSQRLHSLSAFQLSLIRHAMRFPSANRIVYSTCSVHWQENESVVRRALQLHECRNGGWETQRRDEGQGVLERWKIRGLRMRANDFKKYEGEVEGENWDSTIDNENGENDGRLDDTSADACIRCAKDDGQGTTGFFVVAFVRHEDRYQGRDELKQAGEDSNNEDDDINKDEEEEWEGLSDS